MQYGSLDANAEQPKVLIVHDDAPTPTNLRVGLEAAGWTVTEASTGARAMVQAGQCDPDVVLLDLDLVGGDGPQVLSGLRSFAETAWIPVVALSASADSTEIAGLLRSGFQDIVSRPISLEELEARLRSARRLATDRRRLASSEASYRRLIDMAAEGLYAIDARGAVTFVNMAMTRMLGRPKEEIIGRHLFEIIDESSRAAVMNQLIDGPGGKPQSFEMCWLGADGERLWVQVSAAPIIDPDGAYEGSFALATDITARRRAEHLLRQSDSRYRSVLNRLPDTLVSVYGADLRLRWIDDLAMSRRGIDMSDYIGSLIDDILPAEDLAILRPHYARAVAGQATGLAYSSPVSGRDIVVDLVPIFTVDGETEEIVTIARDVSVAKKTEGARRAAEKRFRAAVDETPTAATSADLNGSFVRSNG